MPRWFRFATLFFLALSANALEPRRDLDVTLPPGTPLEWIRETRQPVPTGLSMVPTGPPPVATQAPPPPGHPQESSEDLGGGTVVEPAPPKNSTVVSSSWDYGVTDAFALARISTVDIVGHLKWVNPEPGTLNNDVITGGGVDAQWVYPPVPSEILYWFVLAPYLRRLIHPSLLSDAECVQYLTELGEPALYGAGAAMSDTGSAEMARAVKSRVTGLPSGYPTVKTGKTTWENMMYRLITEELTSGFVFELNPYFACRTLAMGERAFPFVKELTKSSHTFLARNATAVLANFRTPAACDELIQLAKTTKDHVIRARALSGLIRARYEPAFDVLLSFAGGSDAPLRSQALYGLGILKNRKAGPAIAQLAKKFGTDSNVLWSAIPALGRIGGPDAIAVLKDLVETLGSSKSLFDDPTPVPGTVPDPEGTRQRVLWELSVAGLALADNAHFQKKLMRALEEAPDPGRRRGAQGVLKAFKSPAFNLVVEALAASGEPGRTWLKRIVESTEEDAVLRVSALDALYMDVDYVKETAAKCGLDPAIRSQALRILATVNLSLTTDICRDVIDHCLPLDPHDSNLVVLAMRLLGAQWKNDPAKLIPIVEAAILQRIKETQKPEKPDIRNRGRTEIVISAPVLEIGMYELGRRPTQESIEKLLAILKRTGLKWGRAEAALALGTAIGRSDVTKALFEALDDKIGWVRWCAAQALSALAHADFECDWIFGSASTRAAVVEKWREALKL